MQNKVSYVIIEGVLKLFIGIDKNSKSCAYLEIIEKFSSGKSFTNRQFVNELTAQKIIDEVTKNER